MGGRRGAGGWGGGGGDRTLRPGKTEEAVDQRHNKNNVKAVGTSPLRSN